MDRYLLKNLTIYDGLKDSDIKENIDIYIEKGIIKDIGKELKVDKVKIYDMKGYFALPGLINLHVHLPASGKLSNKKVADQKKLVKFIQKNKLTQSIGINICVKSAKEELYSGVTTIRAVGGIGKFDTILRNLINDGKKIGPRILACDTAIGVVSGHMDGTVAVSCKNIEEAVKMVDNHAKDDVDWIKLMITGGILDTKEKGKIGILKMPKEMVKACCDEAHKLNLKVAAHIEGEEGVEVGILNGVDTIEHGAKVKDQTLDVLKNEDRAYVATFSPAVPLCVLSSNETGYSDEVRYNSSVLLEGMKEFANKCLEKNIKVGLGTDTGCPLVTHYDMWRELFYFTKFAKNVDNKFAIHTATLINAEIAGVSNITGSLEIGKSADILICKGNPLTDISILKDPYQVIYKGKIYHKKVKKYKKEDELLEKVYSSLI